MKYATSLNKWYDYKWYASKRDSNKSLDMPKEATSTNHEFLFFSCPKYLKFRRLVSVSRENNVDDISVDV